MKKDKITVVVPIYNTEDYLGECLESLLCQTYDNLSIICVNDGSTDNSQEIINSYKRKDKRISSIKIKNSGAATARNKGIDKFLKNNDSNYITFVDSDDTVENDFIESLYKAMLTCEADISTCNLYRNKGGRGTKNISKYSKNEAIYSYFKDQVFYESPCCKLIKKEIIEKVRFADGKHFEDTFICYRFLNEISTVGFIDYGAYNVRDREGSTTRTEYNDYNYDKVEAGLEIYNNYKNTEFEKLAYNKYLGILLYFILKTNKKKEIVSKNAKAHQDIKDIISCNGFKNQKLKFVPFSILAKIDLLRIIKI